MATGGGSQSDIVRALVTIAGALSTPSSSGPAVPPPTNSGGRGEQTDTTQAMQNLDTTGHSSRSDTRYVQYTITGSGVVYTYAWRGLTTESEYSGLFVYCSSITGSRDLVLQPFFLVEKFCCM